MQRNSFEVQMDEIKIHIGGFQETQSQENETRSSNHLASYITVSSKRQNASDMGCELWISKTLSFGTINGEDQHIIDSQVIALVQEPRLFVVRVMSLVLNAIIIVAHAPWSATDQNPELQEKRKNGFNILKSS